MLRNLLWHLNDLSHAYTEPRCFDGFRHIALRKNDLKSKIQVNRLLAQKSPQQTRPYAFVPRVKINIQVCDWGRGDKKQKGILRGIANFNLLLLPTHDLNSNIQVTATRQ